MENNRPSLAPVLRSATIIIALLPAIYVFVAIQYGALTVPYWDHVELARMIETVKLGGFSFDQLWAPHNHSRPLFYRLIYLPNALMTGWDLRSEFVYMYAAIYAGFVTHAWILFQNRARRIDAGFCVGLALVSLVYFSPVGHMNHWWSMMLQLQLGNVFILIAIWTVANRPTSWTASLLAAAACWIATYTITNGIFAFAICAGIVFLSGEIRANIAKTCFWIANILLMFAIYLPGLPDEAGGGLAITGFLGFIAVYLGLPLGGLLHFEYVGPFTHPPAITLNAVCGIALLVTALVVLFRNRSELAGRASSYRFLLACVGFALLSALVTAEGRSSAGAVYANSSRYAIYSGYLLLGLLHYYASTFGRIPSTLTSGSERARRDMRSLGLGFLAVLLMVFGINAYRKGIEVYKGAHDFNNQLTAVYNNPLATDQEVTTTYPDVVFARHLRQMMSKYALGPYRYQTVESESLSALAPFTSAIRLENGVSLRQKFKPSQNNFNGLDLQFVTWQTDAPSSLLEWSIFQVDDGSRRKIGGGRVNTSGIADWGHARLQVDPVRDSAMHQYELVLQAPGAQLGTQLIGVPVFATGQSSLEVASDGARAVSNPGSLGIRVIYGN